MNRKADITQAINTIAGKYSAYEVYSDWIRCMALSISNTVNLKHDKVWQERERMYLDTMQRYSKEEVTRFCEMTAWLIETLEDSPDDVLGDIYMKSDMGSKATGQFFTPFHLSVLNARLLLCNFISSFDGEMTKKNNGMTKLTINEPSCGGGGMIIAVAKVLHEAGINYQSIMEVVAQDLDWKGVYMCYVQLSLLGISALCVQGDTLCDPYVRNKTEETHILRTPRKVGVLI